MYFNDNTTVFLDGKWLAANEANGSLFNQTLHYGSGVFEGIRSYETPSGTKIFKAKEHYERFLKSAKSIYMKVDFTVDEMIEATYELLERNNLTNAYIRPLLFLPPNMSLTPTEKSHLFICAWEWGKYLGDNQIRVMSSSYQRPNPKGFHVEAKIAGHYVNSILATTEAKQNGYDEALLTDINGYVAEGPGANFFYEKNGKLFTPPLGSILPGITRKVIMELAAELDKPVEEKQFTLDEVKQADSAFFTGTAAEVIGFKSLDEYVFPQAWENSLGAQLAKMYQKLTLTESNETVL